MVELVRMTSLLFQYPTARPARYAAPIAVVSTHCGRCTGASMISAWNFIKKSFLQAPPSTLRAANLTPAVGYWNSKEDVIANWAIDKVFDPEMDDDNRKK